MADELTVESALIELREMFPQAMALSVERRVHDFKDAGVIEEWDICVNRFWIGDKRPQVSISTLSEAMAHVRSWKAAQDAAGER